MAQNYDYYLQQARLYAAQTNAINQACATTGVASASHSHGPQLWSNGTDHSHSHAFSNATDWSRDPSSGSINVDRLASQMASDREWVSAIKEVYGDYSPPRTTEEFDAQCRAAWERASKQSGVTVPDKTSSTSTSKEKTKMAIRMAQVFIIDPHVPLDMGVLVATEAALTDLTDQELFYQINVAAVLEAHNKKRVKVDRKDSNPPQKLKPARTTDLIFKVVTTAQIA